MIQNEKLNNLLNELSTNENLTKEFINYADTFENLYNHAFDYCGGGFTIDEFSEAFKELSKQLIKSNELGDKDLENVSGGGEETWHRSLAEGSASIVGLAGLGLKIMQDYHERKDKKQEQEQNSEIAGLQRELTKLQLQEKIKRMKELLNSQNNNISNNQ